MTCISRPPFIASHYSLQCLTQKPSFSPCLNSFTSIHLIFLLPNPPPNKATVPMNAPGIWTQNKKFVHILLFYLQFQSQFPMFGSTRGMVQWQLDSMQYSIRILMYYSIHFSTIHFSFLMRKSTLKRETIVLVVYCVNRWYAVMELHMFVALILYKFEFTLLDPVPKPVRGLRNSKVQWRMVNKPWKRWLQSRH